MTKEEFLSMIEKEIEALQQEYDKEVKKYHYYLQISTESEKFKEAEKRTNELYYQIAVLKQFIQLPAYARIEAMSDIEIDEYRKEKIAELEEKKERLTEKEDKLKTELAEKQEEEDKLVETFVEISDDAKDEIINKGRQLANKISTYDKELEEIRKKMEEIDMKIAYVKKCPSIEIKNELLSQIEDIQFLRQEVSGYQIPIDEPSRLLASVADNPEKKKQMVELLEKYKNIRDNSTVPEVQVSIYYNNLPVEVLNKLYEHIRKNERTGIVHTTRSPEAMLKILEEYEEKFKKQKVMLKEEITYKKLIGLVGCESIYWDASIVNMEFLDLHKDKIEKTELENLRKKYEERSALERKVFKSKDVQKQIKKLTDEIISLQKLIYEEITRWYESQGWDYCRGEIFHFYNDDKEKSKKEIKSQIETFMSQLEKREQAIADTKVSLQNGVSKEKEAEDKKETTLEELAIQIRALGGEEYKDTQIYAYGNPEEYIEHASKRVKKKAIVDRVQKEAHKQADVKEAELRGMLLEELYALREKIAKSAINEQKESSKIK